MIIDPHIKNAKYGKGINFILDVAKTREKDDDDFFILTAGARSTGKSRLVLHILQAYMGDRASVDYIGLRKGDFANALFAASKIDLPRMCINDEGNISSKEVMSKFNREVMDTYFAIRGKNIFHVWCNPSIQGLDKQFIKEIVNGVIFTYTKYKNMRLYYYFTKNKILKIFEKHGNLELPTLKKCAKKYAHHRGWFYDYDGFLLPDYLAKKDKRMDEKINNFHENWGMTEDRMKKSEIIKHLQVSRHTFLDWQKKLKERGLLDDVFITAAGRELFLKKHIDIFRDEMKKDRESKNESNN